MDIQGEYLAWDAEPSVFIQKLGFQPDGRAFPIHEISVPDDGSGEERQMRLGLSPGGYLFIREFMDNGGQEGVQYDKGYVQ